MGTIDIPSTSVPIAVISETGPYEAPPEHSGGGLAKYKVGTAIGGWLKTPRGMQCAVEEARVVDVSIHLRDRAVGSLGSVARTPDEMHMPH